MTTFNELTTFHVGGSAQTYLEVSSEDEFISAIREADQQAIPVLVIGGGSNLLVSDKGFAGIVIKDTRQGITPISQDSCGGASFEVVAGHNWDDLVATAVDNDWVGLEALSGIPGSVGAAPVQNIGAYGQEVAGVIAAVRVWDRTSEAIKTLTLTELGFGYRTSRLKRSMKDSQTIPGSPWHPTPAYVVLSVAFQTRLASLSAPVAYQELARHLGAEVGQRVPNSLVRQAVLELRAKKGMLVDDPAQPDYDRWSAGSFFTNPVIDVALAETLPPQAPRFEVRAARPALTTAPSLGQVRTDVVKTSAAWLIENAGFSRGYGLSGESSAARLSTRHTLAITNRGHASAQDIVELARAVRDGVWEKFGIRLEPEPVLVGVEL